MSCPFAGLFQHKNTRDVLTSPVIRKAMNLIIIVKNDEDDLCVLQDY